MKTESELIAEGMKKFADSYPNAQEAGERLHVAMQKTNLSNYGKEFFAQKETVRMNTEREFLNKFK